MTEFFEKLQDSIELEENIEGVRDMLLAIYRNGTISVKKIARITKIPVPVVSKVVNILKEKKMLSRDSVGVQFWEHSMKYIEDTLGFYGYGIESCPACKGRKNYVSPRMEEFYEILNPIFEERPSVDTTYDQSKNTSETAIQRALYFYNNGSLEGKDLLFIGDDDFTSVSVGLLYKIFFPDKPELIPKSITVVDLDDRILNKIKEIYKEHQIDINCVHYDLKNPVPTNLMNKFDTIVTDPPYSINGLKLFISRAASMLKSGTKYDVGKEIYLSFAHRSSQRTLEMQRVINDCGLAIMEVIPRFNKYEGAEVLGNETQILRLKSTSFTQSVIDEEKLFEEKIYTGEAHPYIRKYKCKNCGEIIEVGPDQEFETIELLKGYKCPNCRESKKFDLIERNLELDE